MLKNNLGKVLLNPEAQGLLVKLADFLSAKHYSPLTILNYLSELRYLFG